MSQLSRIALFAILSLGCFSSVSAQYNVTPCENGRWQKPASSPCANGRCEIRLPDCANNLPTGNVQPTTGEPVVLVINPLVESDKSIDLTSAPIVEVSDDVDRLEIVTRATVRVTVQGTCGSGTVVGFDGDGKALVLTNAHVAGTKRGRVCNVERWNVDGNSEKSTGEIIASGYARGLSVDFALLRCSAGFAEGVVPIPIADRYPKGTVTNYGCPRCEWPSLQTLKITDGQSQVLRWKPEAIGGRSGSSVVDYNPSPRVVGLLTWGGGGEGLGQSSVFLLEAMRGRMPKSFEALPLGVSEVPAAMSIVDSETCPTKGMIDNIVEPTPDPEPNRDDDDCGLLIPRPGDFGKIQPPGRIIERQPRGLGPVNRVVLFVILMAVLFGLLVLVLAVVCPTLAKQVYRSFFG